MGGLRTTNAIADLTERTEVLRCHKTPLSHARRARNDGLEAALRHALSNALELTARCDVYGCQEICSAFDVLSVAYVQNGAALR
jgi:hypothetical protein